MFKLHQRLKDDTVEVADFSLSRVLLMKDRTLPWLILVPRREGISEIYELSKEDRAVLMEEITLASKALRTLYSIDKINIGSLGNLVPQLHIHVVGRSRTDRAWPGPVWGRDGAKPYTEEELAERVSAFKDALKRIASAV